ncbi:von Willebrand factor type A protein, partial [Marine Group I thaumarchaeote SCGC AAA799-P11]
KGENVIDEYNVLLDEDKKTENKGLMPEAIGIQIPSTRNVDETTIYDMSLINGLKTKFKEWKTGWKEQHLSSGDEFDEENYIEGNEPFFTDIKKSIKTKIVILLDHSSSISSDAIEYKKATLALCEVLAYLKVKFAVYAFSTENRSVVCWSIKPDNMKWNSVTAKRLAQIVANGSTPLAEVYDKMFPVLQSKRPDIFLTLTDGEPSDPDAVRNMTKLLKGLGISMVALGLGPNTVRATTIANNLRHLGYEKTMAVSRLRDIPNKVIKILDI